MKSNRKFYLALPILIAIFLSIGIFLGKQLSDQTSQRRVFSHQSFNAQDKLQQVIDYINNDYVDTIQKQKVMEQTISDMLQSLDPHSYYIPKSDYHRLNDPLEGNFEGIGIEFRIKDDTVMVVRALGSGPSEKVGIMAGDRIVKVEGNDITGKTITNDTVIKLLKGPKGTTVNIAVKRQQEKKLLDFTIQRDKIPLYSVDASYMMDDTIGYIKISRFARQTYEEFHAAAQQLQKQGMKKLIVDLRNNGGGYLQSATQIADEFLGDGKLIVYTEGRSRERKNIYATAKGILQNTETAILINQNSASASEILAGALQDNDKGHIIGRRSFGKGLVQEGIQWPDGSAMRLTVARYYTPTGRSIQKSYNKGLDAYYSESYKRFEKGELLSPDSIDFPDSLKFETKAGKVVYGGGGIMPDYFVPIDTASAREYFGKLNYSGMFYFYGFQFADKNRKQIEAKYDSASFVKDYTINAAQLQGFYDFATKKGVSFNAKEAKETESLIKNNLKAIIARNLYGDDSFYQILNQEDEIIQKAVEVLEHKKSS